MNCEQVRALVGALPRELWSAEHTTLAYDHARKCDACRNLIVTDERLDARLRAMKNAEAPESLCPSIMARIAREEGAQHRRGSSCARAHSVKLRYGWAIPVGSVIGFGAYVTAVLADYSVLTRFRFSFDTVASMRWLDPFVVLGVAGLLLCLLGMGASADAGVDSDARE